jgi:hypothetical protein
MKPGSIPVLVASLAALVLNACDEDITLKSDTGGQDVHGRLTINALPPHFIDIDLHSRHYHGLWKPVRVDDPASRGINPNFTDIRHQRVSGSSESDPVIVVSTKLTAPDAPPLECTWLRYVGSVRGVCALPDGDNWTFNLH